MNLQCSKPKAVTYRALIDGFCKTVKLEVTNARVGRARVDTKAGLARDQMVSLTREAKNWQGDRDKVLQTITNYRQRLRESSKKMQAIKELVHILKIEAAVMKREKELRSSTK